MFFVCGWWVGFVLFWSLEFVCRWVCLLLVFVVIGWGFCDWLWFVSVSRICVYDLLWMGLVQVVVLLDWFVVCLYVFGLVGLFWIS